jgi:hypothetical protein
MKAIIFILGVMLITNSNAQKFDCPYKMTEYQELFKAKKIAESFDTWTAVSKNCPKENEAVYTDGIEIIQYKIDNAASAEEKEKLVREVLKLYDQYNKYFPLTTTDFEVNKAMTLVAYKIDAKEEIFTLLDRGFTKASNKVTSANAIFTYFSMYCEKYNNGDKSITSNSVIEKYTLVNSLLNQLQVAKPDSNDSEQEKQNRDYKTAQTAINRLIKDLATCENLDAFYTKNYTDNQENGDWITSALLSLSGKCSAKPIFNTLAEKLYAMKVTDQSANFMALANLKQRKFPEAIKCYNESAELQTNPIEKAKIYYTLATGLLANDLPKSKEYLKKALSSDPKMGKAYLFLAQLYSNSANDCGKTDFEKKAVYYLAIQTAQKAGVAELRLKTTADKTAKDYEAKSLSADEISKSKMNGKLLTIGCWINETITFPAK